MQAAILTDLLIVAGTSGATTLPNHIAKTVLGRGKPVIDVNIEENPFSEMAKQSNGGRFIQDTCSNGLQEITELIKKDF
jgi:NAD-dependent deacetylase